MKSKLLIAVLLIVITGGVFFAWDFIFKKSASAAALKPADAANGVTGNAAGDVADTAVIRISAGEAADKAAVTKNMIIGHTCTKLGLIPEKWVEKAKEELHIAYGHTSHGSQLVGGMLGLTKFKGMPFVYKKGLPEDSIDFRDNPFGLKMDLGAPNNKEWATATRKYLAENKDVNVVMWSWCGQLSKENSGYVNNYLNLMQKLEKEFPKVRFVYMTGHLDGTAEKGKLMKNNKQIRDFCLKNNKVLYDFADIESYDPDGVYYGDRYAKDSCDYDSNGDRKPDENWAKQWQDTHEKGVDWFECPSPHSQPLNANLKAYAAWWLMARLAGWDGTPQAEVG
ncbi:MAG TPA: hypothetical protein VHT96_07785 [Clostridia bacterium]|nr:hypothetical protein [Clostridia bacterium]